MFSKVRQKNGDADEYLWCSQIDPGWSELSMFALRELHFTRLSLLQVLFFAFQLFFSMIGIYRFEHSGWTTFQIWIYRETKLESSGWAKSWEGWSGRVQCEEPRQPWNSQENRGAEEDHLLCKRIEEEYKIYVQLNVWFHYFSNSQLNINKWI